MAYPVSISYKGFDLMNDNYLSKVRQNVAKFEFSSEVVPYSNDSVVHSKGFKSRTITINGVIKATNTNDLYDKMFALKNLFNGDEGELLITKHGQTIQYTAIPDSTEDMFDENSYNTNWIEFEIDLFCTTGFGQDPIMGGTNTSLTYTTTETVIVTNHGNAITDCLITMNITDDGGGVFNVGIVNNTNGNEVEVNGSFVGGDEIIVDGIGKSVTKNGNGNSFVGYFIDLEVGDNELVFSVDDDTQAMNIQIAFYKRYM